jgi:hypothetical protein
MYKKKEFRIETSIFMFKYNFRNLNDDFIFKHIYLNKNLKNLRIHI